MRDIIIPLTECKNHVTYKIHSRNLKYGVFVEETKGFIGIREKFGSKYLFTEYHYDTGAPYGTVNPEEELEKAPDDLILKERLGTVDRETGRPVEFDTPIAQGGKGWFFVDTGEPSTDIHAVSVSNEELFKYLKKFEEPE